VATGIRILRVALSDPVDESATKSASTAFSMQ
jgi:hypothetical protein